MCLLLLTATEQHKFVLLMNRDERWNRQAEAIHFWPENEEILAGRDGEGRGTWLGINKKGHCVALTNIRASASPSKTSRGLLVKRLLEQSQFEPEKWLELIKGYACTGFNLVFASVRHLQAFVYCSETGNVREIDFKVEPFTLANARPQSHWPREQRILERFSAVADKDYLDLLSDTQTYSPNQLDYTSLPIRILPTTIGTVDGQLRGTVSSSVITVDYEDNVSFTECCWNTENRTSISFKINN